MFDKAALKGSGLIKRKRNGLVPFKYPPGSADWMDYGKVRGKG